MGKLHFPTKPPCSTRVDVLETGNVPILFSLHQMKNLGMTNELDPKGDKITCQAFGLHSSPVEYSAMGHVVLDLTSLAYHPKSRERSVQPKRHVTFALTEKNPCAQFIHQGVMKMTINLLFVQIALPILKTNMISLLVQPPSRKEPVKEKRESAAERRTPAQLLNRKGPPVWRDPLATVEQDVSGNSRERSEELSILGNNPVGEALRTVINRL